MIEETTIREALPPTAAGRVRQVLARGGAATLVVDASGMAKADAEALEQDIRQHLGAVEGISEVRVALMADKPTRRIIAVGSGKGGVGKSTLTANLAVALAATGRKVGVVDADVYGPSQVMLLDAAEQKPRANENTLIPVETDFGIRFLSMGQLIQPGKAIAWRGAMVGKALGQLMSADWGETEVLLVDMPPGTGDVQLTMIQQHRPAGAIIVTTPQDLALIDATRAIDLFNQVGVPVVGLVENMAGYVCPHCGESSDPFGQGGAEAAARALDVPFLGRVPLAMEIRVASDTGQPPAANPGPLSKPFAVIASRLAAWLDREGSR
ncbi:P-loop NTPase [Altererythrobacter salegens]|uniref:Iron-sulfur cluster carrier protein n=1 Tax=Croceibacterium salegens TaxID=1737568 RepID=A0A6I4ST00_9SPHN|nr:Mrp/NBP35 family ATP-binding protein [Croceibacterium salegens]MXO59015.1 P-loop NTPase [Croceibacterium salegens]